MEEWRVGELINQKLPLHGIKAYLHIDSRWKTLKEKYYAIAEMLDKSGFGWDDTRKMVQCEKSVYAEYCKVRVCWLHLLVICVCY